MNFPIELRLLGYTINLHMLLETLAFFIGFRYYTYLKKTHIDLISTSNRSWILIGAIFGALLGSRLLGALEEPDKLMTATYPLLYIYMNKTILGGLLGGLWVVEITKKILGEKNSSGDLFTFPLLLAMVIGRIGCFFNGITEKTYGIPTSFITGMDLGDGVLRHPVALYEIFFLVLLWISIYFIEKKHTFENGYRYQFFMISYCLFRYCMDFIKPIDAYFYGIGTIQIACLVALFYYSKTIYTLLFHPSSLLIHEQ